ncbi:hypothetical protein H0H93_007337, partial [Arthromyces matolae]
PDRSGDGEKRNLHPSRSSYSATIQNGATESVQPTIEMLYIAITRGNTEALEDIRNLDSDFHASAYNHLSHSAFRFLHQLLADESPENKLSSPLVFAMQHGPSHGAIVLFLINYLVKFDPDLRGIEEKCLEEMLKGMRQNLAKAMRYGLSLPNLEGGLAAAILQAWTVVGVRNSWLMRQVPKICTALEQRRPVERAEHLVRKLQEKVCGKEGVELARKIPEIEDYDLLILALWYALQDGEIYGVGNTPLIANFARENSLFGKFKLFFQIHQDEIRASGKMTALLQNQSGCLMSILDSDDSSRFGKEAAQKRFSEKAGLFFERLSQDASGRPMRLNLERVFLFFLACTFCWTPIASLPTVTSDPTKNRDQSRKPPRVKENNPIARLQRLNERVQKIPGIGGDWNKSLGNQLKRYDPKTYRVAPPIDHAAIAAQENALLAAQAAQSHAGSLSPQFYQHNSPATLVNAPNMYNQPQHPPNSPGAHPVHSHQSQHTADHGGAAASYYGADNNNFSINDFYHNHPTDSRPEPPPISHPTRPTTPAALFPPTTHPPVVPQCTSPYCPHHNLAHDYYNPAWQP